MRARHWIEFVRLLKDSATADVAHAEEELDHSARVMAARTPAQHKALDRSRLTKALARLRAAKKQRTELRTVLLLDDEEAEAEDTDGVS